MPGLKGPTYGIVLYLTLCYQVLGIPRFYRGCGRDGRGWVLGMTVVAGTGVAASLWEPFLRLWMGLWRLLGSDWVQIGHHGSELEYWESSLVSPGCTLGGLRSSWMPFGGQLVPV